MHWQTAVPNGTTINATAASLLDALERLRPIPDIHAGPTALGRWLIESNQAGAIADDTVVWLHRVLLPTPA